MRKIRRFLVACLAVCLGEGRSVLAQSCPVGGGPLTFTEIPAGLPGLYWGHPEWGDYDRDGKLDLALVGSAYPEGNYEPFTGVYRNTRLGFVDAAFPLVPVDDAPDLAWGDCDGDGWLDLVVAGVPPGATGLDSRLDLYKNVQGALTPSGQGFRGLYGVALAWGDYDNDGDLDLLAAGCDGRGNRTDLYTNIGSGFVLARTPFPGLSEGAPAAAWGDIEGDGDLDLVLAGLSSHGWMWMPTTTIWRNDGAGAFSDIGASLPGLSAASAAWADFDGDGDLDLAILGDRTPWFWSSPFTGVFRNQGGSFSDTGTSLAQLRGGRARWGDADNDGDMDLLVSGRLHGAYHDACTVVYLNQGGTFVVGATLYGLGHGGGAWGDYDEDGDLDLVVCGDDAVGVYRTILYRNDCPVRNTPPAAPWNLEARVKGDAATFSWRPAADAETPQPSLTYNLRVGRSPGAEDVMPSHSIVGGTNDGKRLVAAMGNVQHNTSWTVRGLPPGRYYWSVQAVDAGFMGGPWAPEQSVTVGLKLFIEPPEARVDCLSSVSVFLQTAVPVRGLSFAFTYPRQVAKLVGIRPGEVLGDVRARGTWDMNLDAPMCEPGLAGATLGSMFSLAANWELPPGTHEIAILEFERVTYDPLIECGWGEIEFRDGCIGSPPVSIVVVTREGDQVPETQAGTLVAGETCFVRGDADSSGKITIGDPVKIVYYLFADEAVRCEDALDANNNGEITVTDAVLLVGYLFRGWAAPAPPFRSPGVDTGADNLNCPPCE